MVSSLLWFSEKTQLVLERRKGFVKIAMQEGASLVPSFTFGENDILEAHQLSVCAVLRLSAVC